MYIHLCQRKIDTFDNFRNAEATLEVLGEKHNIENDGKKLENTHLREGF